MEAIKNIVWDSFLTLLPALLTAICGFIMWLVNKGIEKLKTQTEKIGSETASTLLSDALNTVQTVTANVVTCTEQTLVQDIKQGIADGIKTKEDLKNLAIQALTKVKDIVGDQVLSVLGKAQINADEYISNLIETNVYYLHGYSTGYQRIGTNEFTTENEEQT